MKKTILFLSASMLALLGASTASAQEVTVTGTTDTGATVELKAQVRPMDPAAKREALKAEIELKKGELRDKKADIQAQASSTKAENREKVAQLKANASSTREDKANASTSPDRVAKTVAQVTERLNDAVSRLEELTVKIDSRLDKFEADGGTTTEARAKLAIAEVKIAAAKTSISAIASIEVSSSTPKATIATVKKAAVDAQKAIQEAKQALMETVPAMKGIQASIKRGPSDRATTTAATTTATTTSSN